MAKSKFDVYRRADRSLHGRLMPLYVGFIVLLVGGAGYLYWYDMGLWPGVPAQVLSASVEQAGRNGWQPSVTYQYRVDGETYRASYLAPFGFPLRNRETVEQLTERFQQAAAVVAYVNPRNPNKAYLIPETERRAERFFLGVFALGAVTILLGTVFLLKTKPKQSG